MLLPLIQPVPVVVQRINQAVTKFDSVAREPVRQLWRAGEAPGTGTAVTLSCQVNWNSGKFAKPTFEKGGPELHYDGYVLTRFADLLADGIATDNGDGTVELGIARGDRIVQIGRLRTNLYVSYFRIAGHWTDQLGGALLEIDFVDRAPSE